MKCFKEYTPKEVIVLLLVVGVIGLGTISILRERLVRVDRDLVTVRSEGKIYARPDIANISFGFKSDTKKEAKDAINEGSQKMSEIISALKKWGIEERDIKTTMYDLRAVYEYPEASGKAVLTGYELNQQVNLKIRDIAKVGEVISEGTKAGANQVGGINFTIDKPEELKAKALEEAIKNAKIKARQIEKNTGVELGEIVNVYEYSYDVSPYRSDYAYGGIGDAMVKMEAAPSIEGGEMEIIVSVDLTYEVE